jgi:hypothetical protein
MRLKGIEKVKVSHLRPQEGGVSDGSLLYRREDFVRRGTRPASKGGMTTVQVMLADGRYGIGVARCSKKDNFSYAVGRKIALDRALRNLKEAYTP